MNQFARSLRNLFFVVCVALAFASSASAITLTEPSTGLQVDVPGGGYKLAYEGDGTYLLKKKKAKVRFVIGRTALDVNATADDFINNSTNFKVKKDKRSAGLVQLNGKLGKKKVDITFRSVGDVIEVATFSGKAAKKNKKKKKKKKKNSRSVLRLTAREIVRLNQIIATRRGGNVVPLPANIPTVRFTASDGGSTALVPNLPGWSFSGADGIISGGHPTQGIVNLGIPVLISLPNNPFANGVVNNLVPADQAIAQIFPKYNQFFFNTPVQVLSVQQVPGSEGWLGNGFNSAMHVVVFTFNGLTWQSMFVSGVTNADPFSGTFLWYFSYIAAPLNAPPGLGAALLNTWGTWDNTVANIQRLEDIRNTILTTPVGTPIDPEVFDRIHQKWVNYIKQ